MSDPVALDFPEQELENEFDQVIDHIFVIGRNVAFRLLFLVYRPNYI